ACLEIPSAVDEVKARGVIRSLRAGPCQTSLEKISACNYDEVLQRCRKYINLEEMEVEFAKQEELARPESKKEKPNSPKMRLPRREGRARQDRGREDRWKDRPIVGGKRFHGYTPLNAKVAEVLVAMEKDISARDVTWPRSRFEGPTQPKSRRYCRFHKDYGHTTEDCRHLRMRSSALGDDGKRRRVNGYRGRQEDMGQVKRGTIYMISGGPTDGDSNNARRGHFRAVKRKREEVGITARVPEISFRAEDAEVVVLPHNDALVITAEVAGYDVKRVFIDMGSSVDVMFYDCSVQINRELNMELEP
ncbi:Unknown protein, partial [Striga hermonthica]